MVKNLHHLINFKFGFLFGDKAPTTKDVFLNKLPMDFASSNKSLMDIPFISMNVISSNKSLVYIPFDVDFECYFGPNCNKKKP